MPVEKRPMGGTGPMFTSNTVKGMAVFCLGMIAGMAIGSSF